MTTPIYQNVIILRHGDRIDFIDNTWVNTATRKWDPELVEEGIVRAFKTGQKIRTQLGGVQINRAFVSPFLRCLQTAAEAISALSANVDTVHQLTNFSKAKASEGVDIDSSKIKVSIEFGLFEMLNFGAITPDKAPKDGKFSFDIPHCESLLSAGTIDHNVEPVYKEMPKWEETAEETFVRYVQTTKALADKYPSENLLLVTHATAILANLPAFKDGVPAEAGKVEFCGYLHLRRPIYLGENQAFTAGQFELVLIDGVKLFSSSG